MATSRNLDRLRIMTLTSDRPVIVPVHADIIRPDLGVTGVGLGTSQVATIPITVDRKRIDHTHCRQARTFL